MKKYINENVLTDIIDRSRTSSLRKEDMLHPKNNEELNDIIESEYEKQRKNLDLRHIDVSKIDDFSNIFFNMKDLETIDVTGWDTSNVKYIHSLFEFCKSLKEIKGIENWDVSHVTNMYSAFYDCKSLEYLDLSGWNTRLVDNMYGMFRGCSSLKEIKGIENWDVSHVTNMYFEFFNCKSLEHLDLSGWNTGSVKYMEHMFCDCKSLKEIKGIENWDVSNVKHMTNMFKGCGVSYKLKNNMLIKENVLTDIIDRSRTGSLRKEDKLYPENKLELKLIIKSEYDKQGKNLDLRHIDVSKINDLSYIFYKLENLETINVTGWNCNVKHINHMFCYCKSLKEIKGIENWDVSEVIDMSYMFYGCESLKYLDLSKWNTVLVINMYRMFSGCTSLKEIKGIENWDVSNVMTMHSMFCDCESLKHLDLSGWNTSSVEDMFHMFHSCSSLKEIKGIENWDVSEVINMGYMFDGCGVSYKLKDNMLIKENVLTDIIDRSRTGELKKEDDLSGIDMGVSVIWAREDLSIDEKDEFTYDEIVNLDSLNKWRLPTLTEVKELLNNAIIINTNHEICEVTLNNKTINFYGNNMYDYWELTEGQFSRDDDMRYTFTIYNNMYRFSTINLANKNKKKKVRLVKDK